MTMPDKWPHHTLPALTLWQCWASLVIEGVKPYEFRQWPAPKWVRGHRIAIHAGKRPVKREEIRDLLVRLRHDGEAWSTALVREPAIALLQRWHLSPGLVPLSSVLGTAVLGEPIPARDLADVPIADSDRIDQHLWAWPLSKIKRFDVPVPARGALGFWRWRVERVDR
jgi:hypothetical protein